MGTILLMGAGLQTTVTGPTYDPDAQLFFNAESSAGVSLTTTQKSAVNQWVVDAKAAGIWSKFKAIYPIVGGTATAHKFNLKNPADTNAAFRLSFIGGWTHSSTGMLPNGTNAYANTFLTPSNVFSTSLFPHQSFYSRTDTTRTTDILMGAYNNVGTFGNFSLYGRRDFYGYLCDYPSTILYRDVQISGTFVTSGFLNGNQSAANIKLFKNGNLIGSNTSTRINGAIISTLNTFIGATNYNGSASFYTDKECAFSSIGEGLTDLESQLFYQITEKYQVALGRNINPTQTFYYNTAYNNETNAFLFSTQITDNTIQTATNTLVSDLKTANIFTKMKAIYPMVGGTSTTHKFNLINAQDTNAAFRLAFQGGGTHSANGYLPNGTNAWADTFLTPSTTLTLNSQHISFYSRTNSNGTEVEIGCNNNGNSPNTLLEIRTAGTTYASLSASGYTTYVDANSLGLYIGNRTASNVTNLFKNNTKVATTAIGSTTSPFYSIGIGALNSGTLRQYYTTKECAFASIGDGLSDLESQLFYQITEKYQVTLGRNINTTQSFYYNSAYNNETNAFLFSTQITDATIQTATNILVTDLKTAGIYTKMKALYPMVGGTATTHKFNLINAQDTNEAFRLVFAGGVTHSSSGVLFNGTNGWADTFMNLSSNFTAYDIHLSTNINSDFVGTLAQGHIGSNAGATSCNRLGAVSSIAETSLFGGTSVATYGVQTTVTSTTHKGFWCGSRLSNTSFNLINPTGTITANTTNGASTQPNLTMGLGCRRGSINDYYSGFGYSFFSAGVGLTTTEMTALKLAETNFQTALGRI